MIDAEEFVEADRKSWADKKFRCLTQEELGPQSVPGGDSADPDLI